MENMFFYWKEEDNFAFEIQCLIFCDSQKNLFIVPRSLVNDFLCDKAGELLHCIPVSENIKKVLL